MAKTEYIYLTGKFKWFRAHQPDPWGNWKTDFYPNQESLAVLQDLKTSSNGVSGIKNEIKLDDDGKFITLRRPQQKMMKGKVVGFAPPEVLDGSQKLPDGGYAPLRDTPVGNGSDGIVKLQLYTHGTPGGGKAKALRWEAARIDNLVPFQSKKDFDEEALRQTKGLENVEPEKLF